MSDREEITTMIKSNRVKQLLLVAFSFFGSYAIIFIVQPKTFWKVNFGMPADKLVIDILINLAMSVLFAAYVLWLERVMNRRMPWTKHPLRRLIIQTGIQVLGVLILFLVIAIVYLLIHGLPDRQPAGNEQKYAWYEIGALIIMVLMMSALNTGDYLVTNWKKAALQAAEYKIKAAESKQLAAETELQALKLQIDPHFVFNNLSVLSELILKDHLLGHEYTENFARVYRYLLINSKNKLITLREELRFLQAYIFLLNNRIGNGAIFSIGVEEEKLNWQIPPATLQLFVENALKYNRTEKEEPLLIRISTTEDDQLVVYNNLLPLLKKPPSTGIGLQNILGRYALLSDRKPSVEITSDSFTVKVPLIR